MFSLKNSDNAKTFLSVLGLSSILMLVYRGLLALITSHCAIDITSWTPTFFWPLDNIVYIVRTFNWLIHDGIFIITGLSNAPFHSVIISPIIEEVQFRGPLLMLKKCSKRTKFLCALASALIFAICHPVPMVFIAFIFVIGSLCTYLAMKTQNLGWSILFHALYNANLVVLGS